MGVLLAERRDLSQGAIFRAWLNGHVLPAFNGRVLCVDVAVAQRSARLHVPDPRAVRDALIAATALVHGMTVVTRNVADFEPTGVLILNLWGSSQASRNVIQHQLQRRIPPKLIDRRPEHRVNAGVQGIARAKTHGLEGGGA